MEIENFTTEELQAELERRAHEACSYQTIPNLKPDSNRPIERFFMSIRKGDTPEKNQSAKIAIEWIDEFTELLNA